MYVELSFWLEPSILKNEAKEFLLKKKIFFNDLEIIYLPYRLYDYKVELKKIFFKPKFFNLFIMLNGISGVCTPVKLDINELNKGKPNENYLSFKVNLNQYQQISKNKVFEYLLKTHYLISEPNIVCNDIYDVYYPYWNYGLPGELINARRLIVEKINF